MAEKESAASRRRQKISQIIAEQSIGSWSPYAHSDCIDEDGKHCSYEEWRHQDGRKAEQWDSGYCSDPELEALLRTRDEANERHCAEMQREMLIPRLRALAKSILKRWHSLRKARQ